MLKYSLYTIKTNAGKKKVIQFIKVVSRKITSKIDDIIFRRGAHTQQDFRQHILNLTSSEPHQNVSVINLTCGAS